MISVIFTSLITLRWFLRVRAVLCATLIATAAARAVIFLLFMILSLSLAGDNGFNGDNGVNDLKSDMSVILNSS